MWETIKKLLEEKNQLATQMRTLHESASDEERAFTSDENEKWAKMTARVNAIDAEVKRLKDLDQIDTGIEDIQNQLPGATRDGDDGLERGDTAAGDGQRNERRYDDMGRVIARNYEEAFNEFLRSTDPGMTGLNPQTQQILRNHAMGGNAMTPEMQRVLRAQSVGTPSAGGYTVPEGFGDRIVETMVDYGGVARIAFNLDTDSGNPIPFPTNDDTGNSGALLSENTQDSEQDLTFGTKQLDAYMFTSNIVRVSFQLLQDSAFDMNSYLARKLGERIGRATASYYATGTGTAQPEGVVTGAGTGVTAAADEAIVFNDLSNLEHSVDPAYRRMGCHFLFNDNTLKALQQTADSEGRPLWLPAVASSAPATIYGYPYEIDQDIADIGDSNVSVLFGYFQEFYIRRVMGQIMLLRLVERYADYLQVGFLSFYRTDSVVMDSSAIKKLTHPAT